MPRVNVNLPNGLHDELVQQVTEDEYFTSKSEAMRYALRQMLQREGSRDD